MRVITHKAPDFDACAACFIYLRETLQSEDVVDFRSTHDPVEPGAVYIDMTPMVAAGRGDMVAFDHHYINTDRTATEIVWEHFGRKAEYVRMVDESRMQDGIDRRGKGMSVSDYMTIVREDAVTDEAIFHGMCLLFEAHIRRINAPAEAGELARGKVAYTMTGGWKIAYYNDEGGQGLNSWLFNERSVDFIVYENPNGNIGVVRGSNRLSLEGLRGYIQRDEPVEVNEWYFHPNGFIAARGTTKNPVFSPSRLSAIKLVALLVEFLNSTGANGTKENDNE